MPDGGLVFHEAARFGPTSSVEVACGQCIGCRLERSRQWAVRCMHEASLYQENCFITLTYAEEFCPVSLWYRDFQLFMKRLRKSFSDRVVRFYCGGEYGEQLGRPHFHACLFNVGFVDKLYYKRVGEHILYTSGRLQKLWPFGFSSVGSLTFESAAYIARYCVAKVTGEAAKSHYRRVDPRSGVVLQVEPEFNRMSLRPGVGGEWMRRYHGDVYPKGKVVVNGHLANPPRYYDKLVKRGEFEKFDSFVYDDLQTKREYDAYLRRDDNTVARLAVKEAVAQARVNLRKRELE